ncbi:MAG: hypothetical protein HZB64_03955 [Rhodocyclales bacterium]|nr:hypothetical protein [Rhodocyclales bacterium]
MINSKLFEEMSARVASVMASTPVGDIEKNLRAVLWQLEARLAELEAARAVSSPGSGAQK